MRPYVVGGGAPSRVHPLRRQDHPEEYAAFFEDPAAVYLDLTHDARSRAGERLRASGGAEGGRTCVAKDGRPCPLGEGDFVVLPAGQGAGAPLAVGASQGYTARFPSPLEVTLQLDVFVNKERYNRLSGRVAAKPAGAAIPASVAPSTAHGFSVRRSVFSPPNGARVIEGSQLSHDGELTVTFEEPGTRYVDLHPRAKSLTWARPGGATAVPLFEEDDLQTTLRVEARMNQGFVEVVVDHADEERAFERPYWLPPRVAEVPYFKRRIVLSGYLRPARRNWVWLCARREVWDGVAEYGHPQPGKGEEESYKWADPQQRPKPQAVDPKTGAAKATRNRVQEYYAVSLFNKFDEWCGMFAGYAHVNAGFDTHSATDRLLGGGSRPGIFQSTLKLLYYWGGSGLVPHANKDGAVLERDCFGGLVPRHVGTGYRDCLLFPRKADLWARWRALDAAAKGGEGAYGRGADRYAADQKQFGAAAAVPSYASLVKSHGETHYPNFRRWLDREIEEWLRDDLNAWGPRRGDVVIVNAAHYEREIRPEDGRSPQRVASHVGVVGDYDAATYTLTTYEGNHSRRGGAWRWQLARNFRPGSSVKYTRQGGDWLVDIGVFQFYAIGRFDEDDFAREPGAGRQLWKPGDPPGPRYYAPPKGGFTDPDVKELEGAVDLDVEGLVEDGDEFSPAALKAP